MGVRVRESRGQRAETCGTRSETPLSALYRRLAGYADRSLQNAHGTRGQTLTYARSSRRGAGTIKVSSRSSSAQILRNGSSKAWRPSAAHWPLAGLTCSSASAKSGS